MSKTNPFGYGKTFSGPDIRDRLSGIQGRIDEIDNDLQDHYVSMREEEYADTDHPEIDELVAEKKELADEAAELEDLDQDVEYIPEGYFQKYAEELAEELLPRDTLASWPCTCVDWKEAAEALQSDYTVLELYDETYYYRG